MHRSALALVALLVLAGCGGATDTAPPVTPAPVPEPTADAPSVRAPGLAAGGVANASRLVDAHASALAATSYTVERIDSRRYLDGSPRAHHESTVRIGADAYRYVLDQRDYTDGEPTVRRTERWFDADRGFERTAVGDDVRYRRLDDPAGALPQATNRRGLARLFALLDVRVADRFERGGTTRYRLALAPDAAREIPPLRNISFVAVVDERGMVRSYDLTYLVSRENRTIRVTVAVEFSAIGQTSVATPDWVERAAARTDSSLPRNDSTGRSLAAFHAG